MHRFASSLLSCALLFVTFASPASARAAVQDSSLSRAAVTAPPGSIALASFRLGARLATRIRFPAGIGLGLAICAAGVALEVDHYVRSR